MLNSENWRGLDKILAGGVEILGVNLHSYLTIIIFMIRKSISSGFLAGNKETLAEIGLIFFGIFFFFVFIDWIDQRYGLWPYSIRLVWIPIVVLMSLFML